ncbi:MAG: FeoB-associated Cys-rich membrane protein [Prevotella sp.]|nr:FeoB-associated Cys-rich membrane protein [Prevotella sp.]
MSIQYLIIIIVLAMAIGYAAWRIYLAIRHANDPCYGCAGCALKDIKRHQLGKKTPCPDKKQ